MRIFAFLFIPMLSVCLSFAQGKIGKINGSIKDGNGKPLDGVTISLFQKTDSAIKKIALTDKMGNYEFENLPLNTYFLSASHVGYSNWNGLSFRIDLQHPAIRVNDIFLRSSGDSLGFVTITGKRPLIENRIDKIVVNVDASTTNAGLTALEVLEKSPGVTVDNDGKVSLKGKPGVIIMIDGKPTYLGAQDLANYLKNMPSNQLDQIEIMSQPPAKYDASGNSGVINIITKKNKNAGFNGSVTSSAIVAKYFKNTNSLTFNWRKGKINIYGNYGFSYWEGFGDIHIEKSLRKNSVVDFDRNTLQHT
ncbi:MAG TPA: TonB-dependent receptor, partial [Puia sp.]